MGGLLPGSRSGEPVTRPTVFRSPHKSPSQIDGALVRGAPVGRLALALPHFTGPSVSDAVTACLAPQMSAYATHGRHATRPSTSTKSGAFSGRRDIKLPQRQRLARLSSRAEPTSVRRAWRRTPPRNLGRGQAAVAAVPYATQGMRLGLWVTPQQVGWAFWQPRPILAPQVVALHIARTRSAAGMPRGFARAPRLARPRPRGPTSLAAGMTPSSPPE